MAGWIAGAENDEFRIKMMNFVFKMMNFVLTMINFVLKMINFVSQWTVGYDELAKIPSTTIYYKIIILLA